VEKSFNFDNLIFGRARILLDPLSYMHPHRLTLPGCFDTPRHRSVLNRMILDKFSSPDISVKESSAQQQLEKYWRLFPYICELVGAQILKSDLARCGRSLRFPESISVFMNFPFQHVMVTDATTSERLPKNEALAVTHEKKEISPALQIQGKGLSCVLNWQRQSSMLLLSRFRLLFPPELDWCFYFPRRPAHAGELFLISQAIKYAKNHTDHA